MSDYATTQIVTTGSAENCSTNSLKIVTWNVLKDEFRKDLLFSDVRYQEIIKQLKAQDADIICLQEVSKNFLQIIQRELSEYHTLIDEVAFKKDSVLILSKFKHAAHTHQYNVYKRLLVCEFLINDTKLFVANVHLTSDHGSDAPTKRSQQIKNVLDFVGDDAAIICGDFNANVDEQIELFQNTKFVELSANITEPTFEPSVNSLAKIFSLTNTNTKIDAIFSNKPFVVCKSGLFAKDAISQDLYCSDHYGIVLKLKIC